MFRNYLKTAMRSFSRQKGYVMINMIGLAVGIAASLLIFIFVQYHLNFDNFHEKGDRIQRVLLDGKIGGQEVLAAYTAPVIGPTMKQEFPEVEKVSRMNVWGKSLLRLDERHYEEFVCGVDSTFFSIFSIPFVEGDPEKALAEPYSVVFSESAARRVFGNKSPMGEMIHVGDYNDPFKITGVYTDIPENSHLQGDVMISFVTNNRANSPTWLANSFDTYLLLKPGADAVALQAKFPELIKKYIGPELEAYMGISLDDFASQGNRYELQLQPLDDIHLNPAVEHDGRPSLDPKYLMVFAAIAFLIIIIAAINYMNLSTARASKRAKEVGIRKVSGSTRKMLIAQFLIESIVLSVLSLVVAVLIIELALPYFNDLLDGHFNIPYLSQWYVIPALISIVVLIGLMAGSYPAFFLSSFKPVKVLHSSVKNSMKNGKLRSILVIFQFAVSIILITGTIVMYNQINFMLNKDLGYDQEQLLVLQRGQSIGERVEPFKNQLKELPGVINVASSTSIPFRNNNNNGYQLEGRGDEGLLLFTNWVDYDFFDTYNIELSDGRAFSKEFSTDEDAIVINESAVRKFAIDEPIGKRFINGYDSTGAPIYFNVIGIAKDFHHESLHSEIDPYMFKLKSNQNTWGYYTVKLAPENISQTVNKVEEVWKEFTENAPMQYFFMDEEFDRLYREEKQNAQLAVMFTVLAIIIATLGLFGLTSFTTEQRTKEIGVRKAMGSSSGQIVLLLGREISILVVVSTIFALPIAWYVLNDWLNNFYYSIPLSPVYFVVAFLVGLGIALLTVSYQALKAARTNPANALRYE